MKLIVGLGNPGKKYIATRHNIGFMAVEVMAEVARVSVTKKGFSAIWGKGSWGGREVVFLLPQTFMNLSGQAVRECRDYFQLTDKDILVVHDELDLPLGKMKDVFDAGAAGHRGVGSIRDHLGSLAFRRLRMGIGRPESKEKVESYVLSPFGSSEKEAVQKMIEESLTVTKKWILEEES